jgi:uncharacterized protein with PIN domain
VGAPARAWFRFYAELNDHLPEERHYQTLEKSFFVPASVKDMIESFGVPHTEVELILINGESADFSRRVRDGDRIAVYPVFESIDVQAELRVRPRPLRDLKFVLDVHLGRLAAYLRMLGFDADYRNCAIDPELVRIASEQQRILLTRDRGLLMHAAVTRGYWLRQTDSRRQVAEIIRRFDLAAAIRPFTRCMACNSMLRPAARSEVLHRIPPRIAELHDRFLQCGACGRVYWRGSHYRRMQQWVEQLLQFDHEGQPESHRRLE